MFVNPKEFNHTFKIHQLELEQGKTFGSRNYLMM